MLDLTFNINISTRGMVWGPEFERRPHGFSFELGLGPVIVFVSGTLIR